jgi:hypothetical protein
MFNEVSQIKEEQGAKDQSGIKWQEYAEKWLEKFNNLHFT